MMLGVYPDYESIVSKKVELLGRTIQVWISNSHSCGYFSGIIENVIPPHTRPEVDNAWITEDSPYFEYYMYPVSNTRVCFINKENGHHMTQPLVNNSRVKIEIN